MSSDIFSIITNKHDPQAVQESLRTRQVAKGIGDHIEGAELYAPSEALIDAINTAIVVGSPLLVTGEPGTGKTQVAFWIARQLGQERPFMLPVNSETRSQDLLYTFDQVSWFHAPRGDDEVRRYKFITPGPLARAYQYKQRREDQEFEARACVLIDEVDKAPRDFPNDLLHALGQHRFPVPEWDKKGEEAPGWAACRPKQPPVVVITSNSERRLPEAFLRRCIFHHIAFDPKLVEKVVQTRVDAGIFGALGEAFIEKAVERFIALRGQRPELRKKPATAELLVWLHVLQAADVTDVAAIDDSVMLKDLPHLGCLIKDRDDLERLG